MPPKAEAHWSLEQETALLRALCFHKPLGRQKHFQLVCLWNELCSNGFSSGLKMTDIWPKLAHFYNFAELEEGEFSDDADNGEDPVEFELPWEDYGHLIVKQGIRDGSSSQATSPAQLSATPQRGVKRGRSSSILENKDLVPSPAPVRQKGKPGRKKKKENESKESHKEIKSRREEESEPTDAKKKSATSSMPSVRRTVKKKPGRPKRRELSVDKPIRKTRRAK